MSNITINRDTIDELVNQIKTRFHTDSTKFLEKDIVRWVEDNVYAKPIAVGLTEEQLCRLWGTTPEWHSIVSFVESYHDWSKTQEFAQPEVIGLTDNQIYQLSNKLSMASKVDECTSWYAEKITEYQKTQSFSKPSWDNAPEWANWLAQDERGSYAWYASKPFPRGKYWVCSDIGRHESCTPIVDWKNTLQCRPAPTIDIGSTWVSTRGDSVKVADVGSYETELGEVECVMYRIGDEPKTNVTQTAVFLNKFKMVPSKNAAG